MLGQTPSSLPSAGAPSLLPPKSILHSALVHSVFHNEVLLSTIVHAKLCKMCSSKSKMCDILGLQSL